MAATRLYLPVSGTPAGNPPFDAWDSTTSALRILGSVTKGSSANTAGSTITINNTQFCLDRQYVWPGLAAGIVFTNAWTVSLQLLVKEALSTVATLVDTIALSVHVRASNYTTLRRNLLSVQFGPSSEFATTFRNKTGLQNELLSPSSSYTTVANDILVAEIGYTQSTGIAVNAQATATYGENSGGADLPVDETSTSGAAWIEFSNTITFLATTGSKMEASGVVRTW